MGYHESGDVNKTNFVNDLTVSGTHLIDDFQGVVSQGGYDKISNKSGNVKASFAF